MMSTTKGTKKIGAVKLINEGFKGMEVMFHTLESIKGVHYAHEINEKIYRPAHRELKNYIKSLRVYLLFLCGVEHKRLKDVEVTGLKAGEDSFVISGKLNSWDNKIIALNTPLMKELDNYDDFDTVMGIIDNIYKETSMYMSGERIMKREDIIVDYMKEVRKNDKFTYNMYDTMSIEEQEALMMEMEKDYGITVREEGGVMVIDTTEEDVLEMVKGKDGEPKYAIQVADEIFNEEDDFDLPIKLNS